MRAEDLAHTLYDEAIPDMRPRAEDRAALEAPPEGIPALTPAQLEYISTLLGRARRHAAACAVEHVLGVIDGTTPSTRIWGSFHILYQDDPTPMSSDLQTHFRARGSADKRHG